MFVAIGSNRSGKSSVIGGQIRKALRERIINPDNYIRGLSDVVPGLMNRHKITTDVCDNLRESLLNEGVSFGFKNPEKCR